MTAVERKFCPVPFREFRVSTSGDLSLCSPTRLKIPVVGNILKDGIEGAWNSALAVELRKSILDGSFRNCKAEHCPALQKGSLPSAKGIQDPKFRDIIDNNVTILGDGPTTLNLHYNSTCNLKCPTCRPSIIGLKGRDLDRVLILKDMILKSSLIAEARALTLCGYGDPFASRPHLELLRSIDSGRFRKLRITLLTNGLLLTPQMWKTFSDAHPLIEEIAVSIDAATPETYALNRGGNFGKLLDNLSFISDLRKEWEIRSFRLNFVVQANNFREMPAFIELGSRLGADRVIFQKMVNSANAGMFDFDQRAVHLPNHPDHAEFSALIRDAVFSNPIVDLYTVSDQLAKHDNAESEGVDVSISASASEEGNPVSHGEPSGKPQIPTAPSAIEQLRSVSPSTINPVGSPVANTDIGRELSALRSENEQLRKDCDALKRALAVFALDTRS